MVKINYQDPGEAHPLYWRPPNETPCGAFVAVDCRTGGHAYASFGNEVSSARWLGHVREFGIPPTISGRRANQLLDDLRPYLERIVAGYRERWSATVLNHEGFLSEDACAAEVELDELSCDRDGPFADLTPEPCAGACDVCADSGGMAFVRWGPVVVQHAVGQSLCAPTPLPPPDIWRCTA